MNCKLFVHLLIKVRLLGQRSICNVIIIEKVYGTIKYFKYDQQVILQLICIRCQYIK